MVLICFSLIMSKVWLFLLLHILFIYGIILNLENL